MDSKGVLTRFGYEPEKCKLLNKGGFGRVYRYCDGKGKDRAVKVIKYDRAQTPEQNQRDIGKEFDFGNMMALAKVGPQLFNVAFDDETRTAAIEMERMDMDLLTFFERMGPIAQSTVDYLSRVLAKKLEAMAYYGVKCLDLKPENVMVNVDENGNLIKLRFIDFDPQFCSELKGGVDQSDAAATAMKLLLAANVHRVHPQKLLLFESDLSSISDESIDEMVSSGEEGDSLFFIIAWHYLIMQEKANRQRCVKGALRDLINEAKQSGGTAKRPRID